MGNPRVLVLHDRPAPADLLESVRKSAPEIDFAVVGRLTELLNKLSHESYDAVVCLMESEKELSAVIRVRKKDPDVPVIVLAKPADPDLRRAAQKLGVSCVVDREADAFALAELVRRALATRRLSQELNAHAVRSQALAQDMRELAEETRRLSDLASEAVLPRSYSRLVPLLVEDQPEPAFHLIQAFAKAGMPFPLPVMKSVEEATAYLSGREPYDDRIRFPAPSLVLLDLDLEGEAAFALLRWIRKESPRPRLPVVALSASDGAEERRRAYELGVNSLLQKPDDAERLVDLVRSVGVYWTSFNLGLDI
jgi:DNA-binding NarL/FixJ family response regulator